MTLAFLLTTPAAWAEDKVTFGTNWKAQAEHGGFYQAVATGLYRKAGLDVTIRMGGPQVNHPQLLAAGVVRRTARVMARASTVGVFMPGAGAKGIPAIAPIQASGFISRGVDGRPRVAGRVPTKRAVPRRLPAFRASPPPGFPAIM
jgi:hypothetical protein